VARRPIDPLAESVVDLAAQAFRRGEPLTAHNGCGPAYEFTTITSRQLAVHVPGRDLDRDFVIIIREKT
jgi:hypothetical protein